MPFHVFFSDRIEDLAAKLMEDLKSRKREDPFVFPKIVTPNPNVGKYLRIEVFSKEAEFCAGVDYPLLRGFLVEQMNLALKKPVELVPDRAYANAIAGILLNDTQTEELKPFRDYVGEIKNGVLEQKQAQMLWQLSDKLAGLLDDYEIHRPDVVENWLAGGSVTSSTLPPEKGSAEAGEAELARRLWSKNSPLLGEKKSMRQIYDLVKDSEPPTSDVPIYLFGHSTLSPLQAKIVLWLAKKRKVFFYHNNPCLMYWADIQSDHEREPEKLIAEWEKTDEGDNSLLRNFGAAGRATVALLQDCSDAPDAKFEMDSVESADRAEPDTVLKLVQESIRRRTSKLNRQKQDASIQIVGTPGLRREVEMVYNSIIGSVWKPEASGERPWPDCSFSDIAVLVPDMATYRPVIESVFDARGEVPYGLIDTTASEESLYLSGFLALMDLGRHGLSRKTLFAVLDNACVRKKFGFDHETLLDWLDLTGRDLHSYDGFENNPDEGCFGWEWGLKRMRLARVVDALGAMNSDEEVPLVPEGGDAAMKLSEIVELLHRELEAAFGKNRAELRFCASGSKGANDWANRIKRLADMFLAVPDGDPMESAIREKTFEILESLEPVGGEWNFEVAAAAVEHYVGGLPCRKGGYLTNGVTIAGLMPMRPVPFKQIYVLGLGEGGFPGRESGTTLDVRGGNRGLSDISAPDMNRYVFLETLMSARDRLVLSYPNLDIEKDAELFPCGPVLELEKFIGAHILRDDEGNETPFAEFKGYPLLERGEMMNGASGRPNGATPVEAIRWDENDPDAGILPSYSSVARGIALAQKNRETWSLKIGRRKKTKSEFTAKELAEYVKNPVRGVMKGLFGIEVAGYRDIAFAKNSPVELQSGPMTWDLQDEVLTNGIFINKKHPAGGDAADNEFENAKRVIFEKRKREGLAPGGFLGEFTKKQAEKGLTLGYIDALADKACLTVCDEEELEKHVLRATLHHNNRKFTAKIERWTEIDDTQYVITTGPHDAYTEGKDGDSQNNTPPTPANPPLPPPQVIEPLIGCWAHLAEEFEKKKNEKNAGAVRTICIVNLDLRADKHKSGSNPGAWEWTIKPSECAERLDTIASSYLAHLDEEVLSKIDYRKYLDAVKKGKTEAEDDDEPASWSGKKKEFDNNLVIEKIIGDLKERAKERTSEEEDDERKRLEKIQMERLKKIWCWFSGRRAEESDDGWQWVYNNAPTFDESAGATE